MSKAVKKSVRTFMNRYPKWVCKREFESQSFKRFNERPVEFGFVFRKLSELYPRTILDVGTGTTALPHVMRNCGFLVTAVDNVHDYWPAGMVNRHYHVIDDDITSTRITDTFDLVTCISVLEHVQESGVAMRNIFSLLNPGGHLILTCPFNERVYSKNVYDITGSSYGQNRPYVTQSYSRIELDGWLGDNSATLVDQEHWQYWSGDLWSVGEQVIPPKRVSVEDKHQLTCLLMRKAM
jgi:2-polyprenyl-3-methyl-5-hydroxy-6-metoxy-1,4-benzoquinol methylase